MPGSEHGFHFSGLFLFVCLTCTWIVPTTSIQCYSCKGSGPNEVEANIRCLETAYLENCDDFYQYYSEVENSKVLSYEYYYYDDEGLDGEDDDEYDDDEYYDEDYDSKEEDGESDDKRVQKKKKDDSSYSDDEDDDYYYYDEERRRRKRDARGVMSDAAAGRDAGDMTHVVADILKTKARRRRQAISSKKSKNKKETKRENGVEEDIEYEYEYEEVEYEDYSTEVVTNASSSTTPSTPTSTEPADDNVRPSPTMPKEPEHYCYSETKKNNWESYTVEKGCKKIVYCKDHLENLSSWGKPWNFCCDRARCNAKLVKDKPQRIFGMGCRRTDDCIQGYNSRPVCPEYFQSCPRISTSLIKMECRVKSKTMASVKNAARFQHMFREKKCYCAKGYYPRGPICTSDAPRRSQWSMTALGLPLLLLRLVN